MQKQKKKKKKKIFQSKSIVSCYMDQGTHRTASPILTQNDWTVMDQHSCINIPCGIIKADDCTSI